MNTIRILFLCQQYDEPQREYLTLLKQNRTNKKHKTLGLMLRFETKWIEEGETKSNFFLNIEKQNYCNKLIANVQMKDKMIKEQ